ncbi:MAG: radical SAM protein [Candidatus Aminicenantales bacterium]
MRMTYRFPDIPQMKDIRLKLENKGKRLRFSISGRKSLIYVPLIWYFIKWLSRLGIILRRNGANVYSLYIPPIPSEADNRHLQIFLNAWLFKKKVPFAVTIAVTDECQLNCAHCSVLENAAGRRPMALAEIKQAIAESISLGVTNITFTGGEPLMRADLEEIIAAVPADKAVSLVFTNAVGLDAARAAAISKAGAFGVQISLDSPEPSEHDRLRGREGLFDLVKKGVENALGEGLMVGLSTYASNPSVAEKKLSRLAELAAAWGAHEVSVFDLIPTGRLLRKTEVMLTAASRRSLLLEARRLNRRFGGRPRIITQCWTNHGRGFARFIGCLAGHYQFHISASGEFMPCDFTPLSFGNIRDETVAGLWEKLLRHPAYKGRCYACRMQDPLFRKTYIDSIPQGADMPYFIDRLSSPNCG